MTVRLEHANVKLLEVSKTVIALKMMNQTRCRNVCRRIQQPDLRNKPETR